MNPSEILQQIAVVVVGSIFIAYLLVVRVPLIDQIGSSLEGSVLPVTITPEHIRANYERSKIKILIVPGHDSFDTGAQYKNTREADLTLEVARNLYSYLADDKKYDVWVTRDFQTGDYTETFSTYFATQAEAIKTFRDQSKNTIAFLSSKNLFSKSEESNRVATNSTSVRLYGINKWANEQKMDIVLHIHFNDSPRRPSASGKYSGFVIYAPESELGNSRASIDLAKSLYAQLDKVLPKSDFETSQDGVVENQGLIALGSNATLKGIGILVEYGFVYEPQFQDDVTRRAMTREMAYQTYHGLLNYFTKKEPTNTTTLLPFHWERELAQDTRPSSDVLALQAALHRISVYPPPKKAFSKCPLTGVFGPCTTEAVKIFQTTYGVTGGEGSVGPLTLQKLNELFNPVAIEN